MIFLIISFWAAISFVIVKYISEQILEYRKIKTVIIDFLEKRMRSLYIYTSFLKRFYLFIFREGEGRETEGEKQQCVVASQAPPTGDLARNPGMCPDWESNLRTFGLQAGTQSTEPHQPGHILLLMSCAGRVFQGKLIVTDIFIIN